MNDVQAIVEIDAPRPVRLGGRLPAAFFLGPCALENRSHALEMAAAIREIADRLAVGVVYKTSFDKANRTSIGSYRGVSLEDALPIFSEIREETGLPVVTDVHLPEHCRIAAEAVDVLQIPAFLCRQTDLLVAAAKTGKPVKVKKGQFLAPWDMKHVIGKLAAAGATKILVTERGASFGYNSLVADFRALPILGAMGVPVVFDATHSVQQPGGLGDASGGERRYVPHLARAAAAVGVAAIFMETHENPASAPSDGPNMVPLKHLEALMRQIIEIDALTKAQKAIEL